MSASDPAPLPRLGEVFFDVRGESRSMRLSWYAGTGVAVFSIWQGGTCTGTFRLPMADLPRMVEALRRGPHAVWEGTGLPPAAQPGSGLERGGRGGGAPAGREPADSEAETGPSGALAGYPEDQLAGGYPGQPTGDYRRAAPTGGYANEPTGVYRAGELADGYPEPPPGSHREGWSGSSHSDGYSGRYAPLPAPEDYSGGSGQELPAPGGGSVPPGGRHREGSPRYFEQATGRGHPELSGTLHEQAPVGYGDLSPGQYRDLPGREQGGLSPGQDSELSPGRYGDELAGEYGGLPPVRYGSEPPGRGSGQMGHGGEIPGEQGGRLPGGYHGRRERHSGAASAGYGEPGGAGHASDLPAGYGYDESYPGSSPAPPYLAGLAAGTGELGPLPPGPDPLAGHGPLPPDPDPLAGHPADRAAESFPYGSPPRPREPWTSPRPSRGD
jgi:hypothetical protein